MTRFEAKWNAMQIRLLEITLIFVVISLAIGCGSDDGEGGEFPATTGNLEVESIDWVVDGMSCEGEEVLRMVGLVEVDEGEIHAEYLRGDDCVDEGERFWEDRPRSDGDEVEVLVDSSEGRTTFRAERAGDYAIALIDDGGTELTMRQAYPEINPSPRPELEDLDLADEWWMDGYPCSKEQVPQVVRVIHPPGSLHITKVHGDECIGDGQSFIDAELGGEAGTSISGELEFSESDGPAGDDQGSDEDDIAVELSGTVRTPDYIRLAISADIVELGDAVTLRRIMAD